MLSSTHAVHHYLIAVQGNIQMQTNGLTNEIIAANSKIFTRRSSNCSIINRHNGFPETQNSDNSMTQLHRKNQSLCYKYCNRIQCAQLEATHLYHLNINHLSCPVPPNNYNIIMMTHQTRTINPLINSQQQQNIPITLLLNDCLIHHTKG